MSCYGEYDNNIKWLNPHGIDVDSKGQVHVEYVSGQLRLIFDSIRQENQGKWTCVSDNDESEGKSFIMNVNGKYF